MGKVGWIAMLGIFVPVGLGVANAQNVATVSVNVSSLGKVIPTDFDGFSIEVDDSTNKYLGVASHRFQFAFHQLATTLQWLAPVLDIAFLTQVLEPRHPLLH